MKLRFISLCSGIEAASVAFQDWEAIAFSEINRFCNEFLKYKYPDIPNLGDMTQVNWKNWQGKADVVVSGTPCQAFSFGGKRQSLKDQRGNLTLEFVRACDAIQPGLVFWENVPGILNTTDNAFGCLLSGLVGGSSPLIPPKQLKHYRSGENIKWASAGMVIGSKRSAAWRVLSSQHFGLPQRRKRVFLVAFDYRNGYRLFGKKRKQDLRRLAGIPGAILFEPEMLPLHPLYSSKTKENTSPYSTEMSGGTGRDHFQGNSKIGDLRRTTTNRRKLGNSTSVSNGINTDEEVFVMKIDNTSSTGTGLLMDGTTHTLGGTTDAIVYSSSKLNSQDQEPIDTSKFIVAKLNHPGSNGWGILEDGTTHTISGNNSSDAVLYSKDDPVIAIKDVSKVNAPKQSGLQNNLAFTLDTRGKAGCLDNQNNYIVRRFTPTECLRLQGFPDDYLDFPYRGKPVAPDASKYEAIGNSWAVPCVTWIGERINKVLDEVAKAIN